MHHLSLHPVETRARLSARARTLIDLLRSRSLNEPSLTAYRFLAETEDETLTYGQLDLRARAVAAWLQDRNLRNERALLLYPPGLDFIVAFFGCLYAGTIPVPSSLPQTKRGLARLQVIAEDAQAACVLSTRNMLAKLEQEPWVRGVHCLAIDDAADDAAAEWREPALTADALAYLQYTSGSTSTPKGVMVTHANVLANSAYIQHGFAHGPESVSLSWLPHFHDMGLVDGIIQPLYSGFTGLLMSPAALLQNPASWLQSITRYSVTHSGGPNFAYDLCVRRVDDAQRASLDLSSWSVAYNGAEPVRHETLERFAARFAACGFRRHAFYPAYGLAEATLKVTGGRRDEDVVYRTRDSRTLVGCGRAVFGTEVVIVDPETSLRCEADEVGEIWVAGPGVAAGYWNRPDETEHTFQARLAQDGTTRFLRTGDLGFVRDGELFVAGRLKDLIIIRGRNHYPQDVEAAVQQSHAALKPDGGAAFSVEVEGEERLVVVHEIDARSGSQAPEIMETIREVVAQEFEIQPAAIVLIRSGTLPKTSSGKVRRSACREAFVTDGLRVIASWRARAGDDAGDGRSEVLPDAPEELNAATVAQWLCLLLKQRLDVQSPDVDQPIGRYGIDSLVALEFIHAVETKLGAKLPPASFLRNPTVADLTKQILDQLARPAARSGVAVSDGSLSHGQHALWAVQQVSPESIAYNVCVAVRLIGEVTVGALQRAFAEVVRRHSLLRASFPARGGAPECVIQEQTEISLRVEDAKDWTDGELRDRLQVEAWTSFELESGPLLRAFAFERSAREYVMLLAAHHIIVDFWSLAVLVRELGRLYEAEVENRPAALAPPTPYFRFVRRQAQLLAGPHGKVLREYWLQQLAGPLPVLELPADRARPPVQTYRGALVLSRLDQQLTGRLNHVAAAHDATLFMTLLAAFQSLLYRYTGQEEILVGSPSSGRSSAEFAGAVGYFVNPLVLRAKISGERSFSEFLADTRLTVLAALEHQDYPFDLLVKQLQPERDPARSPLFQVMFAFLKDAVPSRLGALRMEPIVLEQRAAQFDLSLTVAETNSELEASFEYNTDLFDAITIERLSEHFRILLESIATDPAVSVSELRLLSNATRQQLLYDWNNTRMELGPLACVHEAIAQRAAYAPDQIAIAAREETLSYGELNKRANRLARYLRARDVGPEVRVGICVPRSTAMLTCVLAVLKAGGAYVPLDPSYPQERLAFMLENSGVSLVLTEQLLEADGPAINSESDADPAPAVTSENLAYVIYTSGSTGRPKGVMVQHGALANYVQCANAAYAIVAEDRVLQFSSFSFDASVEEIFTCLTSGATLVLRDGETPKDAAEFLRECREKKLTVLDLPTVYWHELVTHLTNDDWATVSDLRLVIIGGDKALSERVERWHTEVGPRVRLVNTYGPTEATVVATMCDLDQSQTSVAIGRPVANTQAYVLDQQLQLVALGAHGELFLGGANVARGYHGDPQLTAQKFIPDPFSSAPGARLYRTGDLARHRLDGQIEFLGRVDQQVKIRGYRIEPAEIETELLRLEAVSDAVVVAREDGGERRLCAYVVTDEKAASELRSLLADRLPRYMIPASFTVLDELPRLPNGKIDRRALPPPATDVSAESYVSPHTEAERLLCDLWAEILKVERVGIDDNFFELGGDSILSIQVSARARLAGLQISPGQVFQFPTPVQLAAVAAITHAIDRVDEPITGDIPLTPIQRWFFEQDFAFPDHWNMTVMLEAREPLDADLLDQAFTHLVKHHDALRLRFVKEPGGWRQSIADEQPMRVLDLSSSALDLANGVLLRACLIEPRRLSIVIHHLVVDGVSWRILLEDLDRVYQQLQRGEAVSFPPRTTSFARWTNLLTEYARSEQTRSELDYWTKLPAEAAAPLPIDFSDRRNLEGETRTVTVALDVAETRALLRDVAQAYGTQINDVLLTALLDAVTHWTRGRSLLIELEGHGREDLFDNVDLSRTVGWFTSAFPVVLQAKAGLSPAAMLQSVRQQLREIPRQGIGYGLLRYVDDDAGVTHRMCRLPVPEISFNYLGQLDQMLDGSALFSLTRESFRTARNSAAHRSQLLEINAYVLGQQLQIEWIYSTGSHRQGTIEKVAEQFVATLRTIINECRANRADEISDVYPLSPLQQGMLFHSVYTPGSTIYTGQLSFNIHGSLDVEAFTHAWRRAVARHAVLRSSFTWERLAAPLQRVNRGVDVPLEMYDWREVPPSEREGRLNVLLEADRRRGFDPAVAPLTRLKLVRFDDGSHRFIWTHHHLLLDGWSIALLLKEVFADYDSLRRGVDDEPPPVRPYRDYIVWLERQDFSPAKSFWRSYLEGFLAPTPLVVDHLPRDAAREADTKRLRVRLSEDESEHLRAFARTHRLTLSTLVYAAWSLLLARYSGESDVVFGATVAGRPATFAGVESMIGLFINTLPVRVRLDSGMPLVEWLKQIQDAQVISRDYEHSPLVEIQALSAVPRGVPLFESLLVFENYPLDMQSFGGSRASDAWWFDETNYPLTVVATPGSELSLEVLYDAHRFTDDVIERMLGHFHTILHNFTIDAARTIEQIELVTNRERSALLLRGHDRKTLGHCVHELFEVHARKTPNRIALTAGGERLTYAELNARANRVAHYLLRNGVETESRVCICLEPGVELIVAVFGVLKARAAYVPLDPTYPDSRLAFMLADCGARFLLTESRLLDDRMTPENVRVVCLDNQRDEIMREPSHDPALNVSADNLFYVIYTSGSTGRPKGAGVTHGGFANLVNWFVSEFELTADERVLVISSFSFDLTQKNLFAPLTIGGELHFPASALYDPAEITGVVHENQITLINCTPSAFYPLLDTAGPGFQKLATLRHVFLGGEPIHVSRLREWKASGNAEVVNTYGPTEASDVCSSFRLAGLVNSPPIGKPIDNVELLILDAHLNLVPQGIAGELCVGGAGVGRGYLNDPSATAERFVPHPYSSVPGARIYRTGDSVRLSPNGNVEFLNRLDHQVKVAGYRIELGEVEAVLGQHEAVKECVVVVRPDTHGNARLVAYVVAPQDTDTPDASTLRRYLADVLPAHMIPSLFVALEKLPLTPGGKVDRRALPAPDKSLSGTRDYVAPRTAVEEAVAGIWREVLGVDRVGIHDNFLELGGHSMLAMRCVSAMRQQFRIEIPLRVLFESATLEELAQAVSEAAPEQTIPRRRQRDEVPLSFAQERLWFLDQLEPGGASYNMPGAVWFEGELNVAALEGSLDEIVRRHEILRTTFLAERGRPLQVIAPSSQRVSLPLIDAGSETEARRLAEVEAERPFDLTHGPLLRAVLVRLSAECHLLLVTLHHIIADGWSVTLLIEELSELYAAYCRGEQPVLREFEISYADYAVWQRQWLTGERLEQQLAYWREQLRGELPVMKLPLAQARPALARHRGGLETVRVGGEVTRALASLGRREGATLFMTLLAAWKVLLWRLSGEPDVIVGTPVAGRGSRELERLIGFFVNTLVLRTDMSGEPSFVEVLRRVREVCLEAYAHQEVPFERVVEELAPQRELSHGPLFQVLFALQNAPLPQIDLAGLRMRVEDATSGTTKFDLALEITEDADELTCVWQYDTDIFDAATIRRMAAHYEILLAGVASDPRRGVHELPLLSKDDEHALLTEYNATHVSYPRQTLLHELFEAQAAVTPDAIAVSFEDVRLTYADLNARANSVAHHLRSLGLLSEERVGVLMERSADLVVALLGVLKAGGACVPLDPSFPAERLRLLIEDSQARVVLTQETLAQAISHSESSTNVATNANPANVAYVIYTSGSSGKPKGVMVTHAALCNHMYWMRDAFAFDQADVFLQKTPIGFDASVWEFYMPLMVGAKLVIARPGGHQDSSYLVRTIVEHGVTVVQVVPALLRMLTAEAGLSSCESLKFVFCGGEALSEELAAQCRERLPKARLFNLYGPAETTIDATWSESTGWTNTATVPIGSPVANAGAYVLDQWLKPVPLGVVGELYLDGAGLARGYEQRADLTAERFLPNPFSDETGARMYRTGDLVRRLPGGELEFLGRVDGQIKVRGSRVEVGEIEAALCGHAAVSAAAVAGHVDVAGEQRLVAYVVTANQPEGPARELRNYLKERLPGHMVPSLFLKVDQLPLLPSGKVDRRALPAPDTFESTQSSEYRPPRTLVEDTLCRIWEEVLGRDPIGADDDFFELGGHSLLATQVVSRVKEALSVELPLSRLFQTPVLSELAEFIDQHLTPHVEHAEPPLQPVSREQPLPLSFAQQRLWFLDQLEPSNPLYNTPGALRLSGRLDIPALERALSGIVRRHETLRTTFRIVDGNPIQIISAPCPLTIPLVDLSSLDEAEREREAQRVVDAEARRPFDLSHGPLLRVTLLRLRDEEHLLLFTMHHIISDGWSVSILAHEAARLYAAFNGQASASLPELPVQYADYAVWQRESLRGEKLEQQLDYWSKQFDELPPALELPSDRPRPKQRSMRGAFIPVELDEELTRGLKSLSRGEGATLFMTLLAAFQSLLSRYAAQHDVAVGVPVANRRRREIEGLIGFFVNTLVLRTNVADDPTFRDLLVRVREASIGAYAHQDVPFEMLVERLQPARDAGGIPLFNVLFVLQNTPAAALELPGLRIEQLHIGTGTAKFDLMLSLEEADGKLSGVFEYSTDLFDEPTITRMLAHFEMLLKAIVQRPDYRVSELPLLNAEEERQLVTEWNQTASDFPRAQCIHDLFYEQVMRTPDAVALIAGGERVSYRELDQAAKRLANLLRRHGVGPESVVAVATGRSTRMAIAVLAVLKAGAAYLPLDPEYPSERLSFMLEDTRASAVLTEKYLVERLPTERPRVICVEESTDFDDDANPATDVTADNLAYVIYTSGSSGVPKAVMMAHRAVCNLIAFQMSSSRPAARTLQFASLNFDVSVQEMFSTWCAGGALVIADEETRRDASALLRLLVEQRVERLFVPFVALQHLAEASEAEGVVPRDLREVITAGEQLKITPAIERLFEQLDGCRLDNHYGPTETHLATMWRLQGTSREWPRLPPVGGPIANAQVYVLDERYRLVPPGVLGELYIGGDGLARGYFNRADQTAERFIPNPFSSEGGARLYKTGDLVRRFDAARIEYVERSDRQVKVRGYRVEVGEIEATLKLHRQVRQAVVTDWNRDDGRKLLIAYVVAAADASPTLTGELKRLLRDRLPEYMVPAVFVRLDQLPLLRSGKVDRSALPAPDAVAHDGDYVAPRTPIEDVLCGIWEQVLIREKVGADDDFFELGGHSLLATQLMSRVRQSFRIELPLRLLFEHPTPARLAHVVEAEMRTGREPLPEVRRVAHGPTVPASFAQQRLWILDKLEPESAVYNLPSALRLDGWLDVAALRASFDEIIRRHEVLRTTFALVDGEPVQVISPSQRVSLPLIDAGSETEARRLAEAEAQQPFDLTHGPLLRAVLVRLSRECHVLLVTLHHIVADGWSVTLLVEELSVLYAAYSRGEQPALAELEVSYADYAVWQRQWLIGERLEQQLAYWREQLRGELPVMKLPLAQARPALARHRGGLETVRVGGEVTRALASLGRREGATLFMTLLAVWKVLLWRLSGEPDVIVGTPVAGRGSRELERLIGFFVNTLVLRTDMSGEPSFVEVLRRVREVCLEAYAHQEVPFERVVEELAPQRELSHGPLFQVLFALQNTPAHELTLSDLNVTVLETENPAARFDLALEVAEVAGELDCRLTYDADLFEAATIARVAQHFVNLLDAVAADPRQPASAIDFLGDEERRQLLFDWNNTHVDFPTDRCIHELFETQAELTPEATAVVFGDQRLSYRELNERANQWAHRLLRLGAGPETLIGITAERSPEMIVGLLAILKAGGAYVPLSPDTPPERLAMVLKDAGIELLLTQQELTQQIQESTVNPETPATAENLAYVIYTSGSTGRPKGVEITHRSLVHSTTARFVYYDEPVHSFMLVSPFFFDSSVAGIFWTLCSGGKLVLPPQRFEQDFAALIEREHVSHLLCLPSVHSLLLRQASNDRLKSLRCVIVAGEPCPPELPARHFETLPRAALFNEYGPTEGTVWATVYRCRPHDRARAVTSVPVGRPVPNAQTYVLDDRLQPAPIGVAGELYIGGEGVARGYRNSAPQTAERFVPHPFATSARLYATGDRARYLPNGELEFLGRRDQQVKVRGYRIELGEIEMALADHTAVREAAVVAGEQRVVAYVTADGPIEPAADELREFLRQRLPEYMLPSQFVLLDAMPLGANGKVDRQALPAATSSRPAMTVSFAAPQTPLEQTIADVWREFLKLDTVGVNDVFFDLGGHSLLLVLVHERLQQRLHREVPIADLFKFPTVRTLARNLDSKPQAKEESTANRRRAGARQQALKARSSRHGV